MYYRLGSNLSIARSVSSCSPCLGGGKLSAGGSGQSYGVTFHLKNLSERDVCRGRGSARTGPWRRFLGNSFRSGTRSHCLAGAGPVTTAGFLDRGRSILGREFRIPGAGK